MSIEITKNVPITIRVEPDLYRCNMLCQFYDNQYVIPICNRYTIYIHDNKRCPECINEFGMGSNTETNPEHERFMEHDRFENFPSND